MSDSSDNIQAIYAWLEVNNQDECADEIDRLQQMESILQRTARKIEELLGLCGVSKATWEKTSIDYKLLLLETFVKVHASIPPLQ